MIKILIYNINNNLNIILEAELGYAYVLTRTIICLACPKNQSSLLQSLVPRDLTIMSLSTRSIDRNVYVFDNQEPTKVLGGLCITPGITNKSFHIMIEVLIVFNASFTLTREGLIVPRNEDPLQPGNYYVVSDGQLPHVFIVKRLPSYWKVLSYSIMSHAWLEQRR